MKSALLVIDVQQGLCEGEGAPFECGETIARINRISEKARAAGAPVVFIQHESIGGYLEFSSDDWQLAKDLQVEVEVEVEDLRVRKTACDSFHRTDLEELLKAHDVAELVICGMHTEFCVDTTVRRALALGYPVVLVEDGHTTAGNSHVTPAQIIQHHNTTLANISSFGPRVRIVRADEMQFSVR